MDHSYQHLKAVFSGLYVWEGLRLSLHFLWQVEQLHNHDEIHNCQLLEDSFSLLLSECLMKCFTVSRNIPLVIRPDFVAKVRVPG